MLVRVWYDWFIRATPVCATKQDLDEWGEMILSKMDDTLNAVSDKLAKAQAEITALIAQLQEEAAAGGVSDDTINRLEAVAQSLDDVVPDEVPEAPPE